MAGTRGLVQASERISIFALGVVPIISALMLVELARLLSVRFSNWVRATPETERLLERSMLQGGRD